MKNLGVLAPPTCHLPFKNGNGKSRRQMIKDHAWQLQGKTPNFFQKTKLGEIISTKE